MSKLPIILLMCWSFAPEILSMPSLDYCFERRFDIHHKSNRVHYTRELGYRDFGAYNLNKTVHCCAHGFSKIEWLKDGKPLSSANTSFIVDWDSNNQTLYSTRPRMDDSGIYTCIITNANGNGTLRHSSELKIIVPDSIKYPQMTFIMRDKRARVGERISFYCEGYVGESEESNYHYSMTWEKGIVRKSLAEGFIDGKRVVQVNVQRDDYQIIGSYLIFDKVLPDDYDMYTCRLTNTHYRVTEQRTWLMHINANYNPEQIASMFYVQLTWTIPLAGCALAMLMFAILMGPMAHKSYWRRRCSICKKKQSIDPGLDRGENSVTGRPEDLRPQNVLVIYHIKDEKEMLNIVVPVLQQRSPYLVTLHPFVPSAGAFGKLSAKAKRYEGIVIFVTPNMVGNEWSCGKVDFQLRLFLHIHFNVICIFNRKLPTSTGVEAESLRKTLNYTQIHLLERKHYNSRTFKRYLCKKKKAKSIVPQPPLTPPPPPPTSNTGTNTNPMKPGMRPITRITVRANTNFNGRIIRTITETVPEPPAPQ